MLKTCEVEPVSPRSGDEEEDWQDRGVSFNTTDRGAAEDRWFDNLEAQLEEINWWVRPGNPAIPASWGGVLSAFMCAGVCAAIL